MWFSNSTGISPKVIISPTPTPHLPPTHPPPPDCHWGRWSPITRHLLLITYYLPLNYPVGVGTVRVCVRAGVHRCVVACVHVPTSCPPIPPGRITPPRSSFFFLGHPLWIERCACALVRLGGGGGRNLTSELRNGKIKVERRKLWGLQERN